MKNAQPFVKFVTAFVLAVSIGSANASGSAQQDYSNTTVNNTTGRAIGLINIYDQGNIVATIYATGKEMQFGANQMPLKGSGYVEAQPDKILELWAVYQYRNIGDDKVKSGYFCIAANRVEWDENGHTTAISGIGREAIADSHALKILSDISKPTLTDDGALALNVEKLGKVTVEFHFGGLSGTTGPFGYQGEFVGDPVLLFSKDGVVVPNKMVAPATKSTAKGKSSPSKQVSKPAAGGVTGSWSVTSSFPRQGVDSMEVDMTLSQNGAAITGTATGNAAVKGTAHGSEVTIKVKMDTSDGSAAYVVYRGKRLSSNSMKGTVSFPGWGTGHWTATRKKAE